MSDQPDQPEQEERRTFWYQCPRGHVEERWPMPEGPPMLCSADVVKAHEAPGAGIYRDLCGEELRHLGPTVGEWRAINEALQEAKQQSCQGVAHLERLLREADAALAECSSQLDRALSNEGDLGAQLVNATEAAMLNRDAAAREATAHRCTAEARDARDAAVHERDVARREASRETLLLHGLREAALAEAERLDEKHRHKAANRLREAVTESWGGNAPGLCAVFATPDVTEPLTLDSQARRISGDLVRELREAKAELARRKRGSQGFTVVRDVNGQTEAALKRAEAALRDAQTEERNARQEVCHWRMVALWCAEREAMTDLPQASFQQRSEVLSDRYDAEMEDDSR